MILSDKALAEVVFNLNLLRQAHKHHVLVPPHVGENLRFFQENWEKVMWDLLETVQHYQERTAYLNGHKEVPVEKPMDAREAAPEKDVVRPDSGARLEEPYSAGDPTRMEGTMGESGEGTPDGDLPKV